DFSLPRGLGSVSAFRGCCYSHFGFGAGDWLEQSPFKVKTFEPRPESGGPPLVPYWKRWPLPEGSSFTQFLIPLWLLSAVCLAWPGTSFLLAARHRGKRGFEVALVDDAPRLRDQRAEG